MAEGESIVEQSEVLSEVEVADIVEGTATPEEAILESDKQEFELPEKFKGKSAEEIAKSYLELEKMKGGGPESNEGEVPSEPEEGKPEVEAEKEVKNPTPVEETRYNELAEAYDKNGSLSEDQYSELAKAGYNKEAVDAEIARRAEAQEFETYKQEKVLNDVLEPLGGGADKFKEVAQWAAANKAEADVVAFNEALATTTKLGQQALLKGLYAEYEASGQETDTTLHTNTPQVQPSKGYKTQEEFFKDVGSEEYQNNAAYRAAVEAKMAKSNIF